MSEQFSTFEDQIHSAIEKINDAVRELLRDKAALERQLILARREDTSIRDVSRKNSVNRIMIEKRIISALERKPNRSTHTLYKEAKEVSFDLRENTFRTQLHRMKNKGLIQTAGRGKWLLPVKK